MRSNSKKLVLPIQKTIAIEALRMNPVELPHSNAGPSVLAGTGCVPNVFSVAWQNDGSAEAMGKYAQDAGYKRVYLMAPNYCRLRSCCGSGT